MDFSTQPNIVVQGHKPSTTALPHFSQSNGGRFSVKFQELGEFNKPSGKALSHYTEATGNQRAKILAILESKPLRHLRSTETTGGLGFFKRRGKRRDQRQPMQ